MRQKPIAAYMENMTRMLLLAHPNLTPAEAEAWVKNKIDERLHRPKIWGLKHKSYGNSSEELTDLLTLTQKHAGNIISPNGCVYMSSDRKVSMIANMIRDMMKNRKREKKAMLKCKAVGDKRGAKMHHYAQATIKININSLPGGFGSAFNLFYDKGGYNSITSTARHFIAHAYTNTEELLGGNFAIYNEEELINWVVNHQRVCPSKEQIDKLINEYNLKVPSVNELYMFYLKTVKQYGRTELSTVKNMLDSLQQHEVVYLYYFNNLRHLIWDNSHTFTSMIHDIFDPRGVKAFMDSNPLNLDVKGDDIFEFDGDLIPVLAVGYNWYLKKRQQWGKDNNIEDGGKMQIFDLPKKDPDGAKQMAWFGHYVEYQLHKFDDLFNTFIFNPLVIHHPATRKNMFRNTVIISDTDSVIFTFKDWVEWYTGDALKSSNEANQIGSLAIYWLTKVIEKALNKASIAQGFTGENIKTIKMKNEFFYPTIILYPLKKTYAGVITIQEGVVLPEPTIDIKGANLRSSDLCKTTTDFVKELIEKDILEPSLNRKISANYILEKVIGFEQQIRHSLLDGNAEFLKVISVKNENEYKNATGSNFFYYQAWMDIFAQKYGEIRVPGKMAIVKTLEPTLEYMEWLHKQNNDIYNRMIKFKEKYGKYSGYYTLNPLDPTIPKELIPIVDIRGIIYHNIRPIYLTISRLGLNNGCTANRIVLFSDLYGIN